MAPSLSIRRRFSGFSMVELLVTLAVIILLLAMLLPSLTMLREATRTATCASGLRHWGMATRSYTIDWAQKLPWEGTFGSGVTRYKSGAKITGINGNTEGDAWYNALPPYVNAPRYGDVYNGTTSVGDTGGYANVSIWYCPSRILVKKNSTTGLNSAQYAMNALLNGSGGSDWTTLPNYGSHTPPGIDLEFNSINFIPAPEHTPFIIESDQNTASESPSLTSALSRTRHRGCASNFLFLDQHVELLLGSQVPLPTATAGLFASAAPALVWGPWKK